MLPLKIKAVQAFCTEMNCTPEESSPRSLWKLLLSPGLSVLGQEARGEAQSPAAVAGTSRVLLHCCCSQAEPRLQWARRNNRGSSSGSKDPACRAWWAQQWVVPRYGAELSSPVCSQGTGARGSPGGSGHPTGRLLGVTRELVVLLQSGEPKAIRGMQGSPSLSLHG